MAVLAARPRRGRKGPIHAHLQGVVVPNPDPNSDDKVLQEEYTGPTGIAKKRNVIEGDAWGQVRCRVVLSGYSIGDDKFDPDDDDACPECVAELS